MHSNRDTNFDEQLRDIDCNCAGIVVDALAFILSLSGMSRMMGLEEEIASHPISQDLLSEEEFDLALSLKSNVELLKSWIEIPGSTRGIIDLCDCIQGHEVLTIRSLEAFESLCKSPELHKKFQVYFQTVPENLLRAIPIILNAIRE